MDPLLAVGLAGASAANSAAPGPCIVVTCSRAATEGVRSGLRVSLGIAGSLVILLAGTWAMILGVLSISEQAWQVLRLSGLAMLVVLALSMLVRRPGAKTRAPVIGRLWPSDWAVGLVVGLSSPWNLLFMFALLPQFVDVGALDRRSAAVASTAVLIGGMLPYLLACYFSARALRTGPRLALRVNHLCGGALLVFAGLALVAEP